MKAEYIVCFLALVSSNKATFGPVYPITASWFRDRYSLDEWNTTLRQFKAIGGDTVWQRAPPIIRRSREDLERDLNFIWCGSTSSSTGVTGTRCFDEASQELSALGIKISAFATYLYEENFSDAIMLCPKFDRKINSSRIYYRLVLPTTMQSDFTCNFTSGSSVVVLFTSYAGRDPHQLLVESAAALNMSVYLGLPAVPGSYRKNGFDDSLMPAYYAFTSRVLHEHKHRYSSKIIDDVDHWPFARVHKHQRLTKTPHGSRTMFDVIEGYYSTDESCLAQVDMESIYLNLYRNLGQAVHDIGKRFAVSPFVDLNRSQLNATMQQHVDGFRNIVGTSVVDVVAVQEGRGAGKGCYYWPSEINKSVALVDPKLDAIIHYIDPSLPPNITYREAFSASNQELFQQFGRLQDVTEGTPFEYWLNIEAFEYLRDDPCLPVDPMASGMGELLQRTDKSRVDRALTVAGATSKKIISFAWDSDFTCVTNHYKSSLEEEIRHDNLRPIIANCSFHSKENVSVVVIGYNLDGETQGFVVEWTDREHRRRTDPVNGYYFEADWGQRNNRVPSLVYIMLWDIPAMNQDLPSKGEVRVQAKGAYHDCVFQYDYS